MEDDEGMRVDIKIQPSRLLHFMLPEFMAGLSIEYPSVTLFKQHSFFCVGSVQLHCKKAIHHISQASTKRGVGVWISTGIAIINHIDKDKILVHTTHYIIIYYLHTKNNIFVHTDKWTTPF